LKPSVNGLQTFSLLEGETGTSVHYPHFTPWQTTQG
jgi:hypothetical protein